MSRVHDMGGRFGDGPVEVDAADAPVFKEDWHGRALALTLASAALGKWNIDTSRHARERLAPQDYSRFSYYEKWIAGATDLLVETGVLTPEDLDTPEAEAPRHELADRALTPERVARVLSAGGPADRTCDVVKMFKPGDKVRTLAKAGNRFVDGGHTRLPSYAAGAVGEVVRFHGTHVFPDRSAHGLGEAPEPLYAVAFAASDLWVVAEDDGDEVILDLWQSYLEPAP
ncbi:nitrile hydratase subunit beta [Epibacterium sp. SM1979]|uniref:Nitrile hydratase subunit beta n=1 Tax=Tritonibacter litoralis TaxID=2662264 RepID=A0A843Y9F2_9RHOB|nr:nitrile hydratase subunit beta [Tritonibacter litoralis]MQQ07880.1 nitrile hydratase subunit beta [Tritonibacter litoralis]